jgi:hypothetical protein
MSNDLLFCCTACDVKGQAKCECGKPYTRMRASEAAALAIAAHPDWSDRQLAKAVGVGVMTVSRARKSSTVPNGTVEKRIGSDGKARKLPERRKPAPMPIDDDDDEPGDTPEESGGARHA